MHRRPSWRAPLIVATGGGGGERGRAKLMLSKINVRSGVFVPGSSGDRSPIGGISPSCAGLGAGPFLQQPAPQPPSVGHRNIQNGGDHCVILNSWRSMRERACLGALGITKKDRWLAPSSLLSWTPPLPASTWGRATTLRKARHGAHLAGSGGGIRRGGRGARLLKQRLRIVGVRPCGHGGSSPSV